ncbi:MAG: hypothetical protein JEZ00_22175 [Anaerolineaceae bacterium]|nr:hypothetical protein [Anaerolineaceae bacterium]
MKKNLLLFVAIVLILSAISSVVPLLYLETRWQIDWENVPVDISTSNAKFRCMTVAENGDLWAGNDNGVVHISGQTWETYASRILHHIRDIEVAPDGQVWVITEKNDVLRFDGQSWERMPGTTVLNDIAITPDGTVWGATSNGLVEFDGKIWQPSTFDITDPDKNTNICAVASAPDGSLWAGGCSADFILFNIENDQVRKTDPTEGIGFITRISANALNQIWLYSMGVKSGINTAGYYENDQWHLASPSHLNRPGIGIDSVYDLSADDQGIAWIAKPNGLCRYNGYVCINYLKGESIYSVATAPDGSIWLGLENEIVQLSQ